MSEIITEINNENFAPQVLASKLPVLVDFWADWCPSCKALTPTIEQIAQQYEGRLKVGKCDVDQAKELSEQFHIMSIPALLFFKDGELVGQHIGTASKSALSAMVEELL